MKEVERQLSKASIGLLLEQPYFGHLLSDIARNVTADSTRSMAIRYEEPVFVIDVHPDFWQHQIRNEQERMGHLFHQLLHLFFGHLHSAFDYPNRFLLDLAADLQVNQYIPPSWHWETALLLSALSDLQLEPQQSLFYYYEKLVHLQAEGREAHPLAFAQLEEWSELKEEPFEPHRYWYHKEGGGNSEREMARWSAHTMIQMAGGSAGPEVCNQLAEGLRIELEKEHKTAPVLNWRKLIRQFAESSRSTYIKETIHRPSKRYGTRPGVRVRRRQRILVGVDTSGSVSPKEQKAFFEEVRFLSRTGADITLVEFDAEIQRLYPYRGQQPEFTVGGGGTNFLPILEYVNTSGPWDGVIVFTDGFAPIPGIGVRSPLLWVITAEGLAPGTSMFKGFPGKKIKLQPST